MISSHWRKPHTPTERDLRLLDILARQAADLIERKQGERVRAQLSAIVESSGDAIYLYDLEGKILTWNAAAEELYGYTASEIVGHHVENIVPPESRAELREILNSAANGGPTSTNLETNRRTRTGRILPTVLTISPVRGDAGKAVALSVIARDITERKRKERAIALLGAIVDSSDDAIISKDLDGVITSWNHSAERMFGYTAQEAIGKTVAGLLIPADRQAEEPEILARLRRGERFEHFDTVRRRKDGTLLDISLTISPVMDERGRVVGASKIARDITARKRAEDELRRANQDLEQFAYSASHDLQEPLRTIKIYSELLASRHADTLQGESAEFLDFLRNGATRMEMLVRDLLSYTQVTRLAAPIEQVDANEALREALANLAGAISESGAAISAANLPMLRVHGTHLRQLFQNLIGNAIKYRHPDLPPAVQVSVEGDSGSWTFSVRDNGIGIESQFREQIFGLFSRLHNTDSYDGTGIGLAICQRIVERYDGRIWVDSEPERGSEFRFTLRG
jgi:hypothetical protein